MVISTSNIDAPPNTTSSSLNNNDNDGHIMETSNIRNKNKLHWNLRSFHLNEESFRARDDDERSSHVNHPNDSTTHRTAAEIFQSNNNNSTHLNCTRTALVDGHQVCFELRENVTQMPTTDRKTRLKRTTKIIHAQKSPWDIRMRLWMVHLGLPHVTVAYIFLFLVVNVVFAALYFLHPNKCCGDPDMTFSQVFDFCVQTSATIGYGGYVPKGMYANFLVVVLTYVSVFMNTVLAGLLFLKFVTPVAKLQFSNVLVYSNCNGLPSLQLRVSNADGPQANKLTDITARLTYLYEVHYNDENGNSHTFAQRQTLELLSDKTEEFPPIWTLRHVVDESSPLFGLNLAEFPATEISQFTVTVHAVQEVTRLPITAHASYMLEDILIGHAFQDQISWNKETRELVVDCSKLSATQPAPVWYPKPRRL